MSSVSGVGTISSAGIGSGLDVNSIVSKLMAIEKQPITNLQTQESKLQAQLSSWGQIKSDVAAFRDAASALTLPSTWSVTTATSSDPQSVSVSTGTSAPAGSYSISVQKLASAQTLATRTQSSATATLGQGTLQIQLGTWGSNQSTFAANSSASTINVSISSTDTINDIRDKINAASTSVTASVVNDASGSRLVLRGPTGAPNGFRTTVTDPSLSALAYDPSTGSNSMTQTQAAGNSAATINGLPVTGTSNALTAIDGMTITLGKVTSSPVDVTVAQDKTSITTSINSFVTAYNNLQSLLADQTKYDASNKTAGTLQGDTSAVSLQTQIRSMMGGLSNASSTFGRMSDMGLEIQTDGTIKVNSSKLTSALGNLTEVKKAFAATGATSADNGFAQNFMTIGDNYLGVDGTITTRSSGLQTSIDNNTKRQSDLLALANAYETRVRAQYTALDATIAQLTTQSNYVTQMLGSSSRTS